ncbi:MAG: SDR family oxidoreductase [Pirellulaceae bacterium]
MTEPTVQQLFDLTGRSALVTGGAGHLGSAMCHALAEAGARVFVASRDAQRGEETARQLPRYEELRHHGVQLDHLDEASLARGFDTAADQSGGLDILVNNGQEVMFDDWSTVDYDGFTRQLANATGYFLLARRLRNHAVSRQMPAAVVMLGSMYGLVGSYPEVYEDVSSASPVAYHALKGGVIQMTRHLAVYWAKDGVRVNCLSPGPFPSPHAPRELVERLEPRIPLGRIGEPRDLKAAVVFLASQASNYMTGHNLVVDGGWTAW